MPQIRSFAVDKPHVFRSDVTALLRKDVCVLHTKIYRELEESCILNLSPWQLSASAASAREPGANYLISGKLVTMVYKCVTKPSYYYNPHHL